MEGSVEERVKQIIVDELGVDEGEVTPNARFIDDLGADSLDTVELVMRFEEEFNSEIRDEDAEKIQSVRDAICRSRAWQGSFRTRKADQPAESDFEYRGCSIAGWNGGCSWTLRAKS